MGFLPSNTRLILPGEILCCEDGNHTSKQDGPTQRLQPLNSRLGLSPLLTTRTQTPGQEASWKVFTSSHRTRH